jgi:sugar lactone lactonase YvrE
MQTEIIRPQIVGIWNGADIRAYPVGNKVGEGPSWHPEQQVLYWIDIRGQQLLRLNPATSAVTRWDLPEVVGALALCGGNKVCLALTNRLVMMDVESGRMEDFAIAERERPMNRLNDGKVSPTGRWFVFGAMDDRPKKEATGALYRASGDGQVIRLFDGLVVSNGAAWSPDGTTIYFSDSSRGLLFTAPWNEATGQMGAPQLLLGLDDAAGRPDGAGVDIAGNYWSAGVSAGCINVINPKGEIGQKIPLPCRAPTMVAFGGANNQTAYVTSLVRPQWQDDPQFDGMLFEMNVGATGVVVPFFKSP